MISCEPTTSKYRHFCQMRHYIVELRKGIHERLKQSKPKPRPRRPKPLYPGLDGPVAGIL